MITLNGKKFVKNDRDFTDTLFTAGGTATGYYKKHYNKILLLNMQKIVIGAITAYGVIAQATPQENGATWYSYGDIKELGAYPYRQQADDAKEALSKCKTPLKHERY